MIDLELLDIDVIQFLLRAKKATYAGKGGETDPSRPRSHDLHYTEGEFKYIDSYLGGEKFAGEEAIWKNDVPFWAMNYIGRVIGENFSGDFLKDALSHVTEEYPFRGPLKYEKGDNIYSCSVKGDFHWFYGYEEIYHMNNKVYECAFHGGDVK